MISLPGGYRRAAAPKAARPPWLLICVAATLAYFLATIARMETHGGPFATDDAYYYLVIARNIATTGVSTFDQQSVTNGYHPLWLLILVLQNLTVGPSLLITLSVEALLLAGGLFLFLRNAPTDRALNYVGFTLLFVLLTHPFALGGMEASLLVFCTGLLVAALVRAQSGAPSHGIALGLAAALCIGARIDSAFFVAPALVAAPASRRARSLAVAVLAVLSAAYSVYNLYWFGTALPISSAVKSLGGLQVNYPLLAQLRFAIESGRHRGFSFLLMFAGLAVSPCFIILSRPRTIARALAVASSAGGLLYAVKLVFLSSWIIWGWYCFAIMFPLLAAFYSLAPLADSGFDQLGKRLGTPTVRWASLALSALGLAVLLALTAVAVARPFPRGGRDFAGINHLAVERYGPVLAGARVAMGDRAGSFAMEYGGPVVQLEGLVNDKAYLEALRRGGDMRGLLCGRGIQYILSYEQDLDVYNQHTISVLRPFVTQFKTPTVDVWRQDEVGHVVDLLIYDNLKEGEEGNNALYIWRLRCEE